MKILLGLIFLDYIIIGSAQDHFHDHNTVYPFSVQKTNGDWESMEKYRGKVVIFVNVASYCGYTDQNYRDLKLLEKKYYDRGLRVAAFPCNQFGDQEPDDIQTISQFVKSTFDYVPDMYDKVNVNGENSSELWKFMKSERNSALSGQDILWNFTKFLVNRRGFIVDRFSHSTPPKSMENRIIELLNEDQ